jgi:hypothetical protein
VSHASRPHSNFLPLLMVLVFLLYVLVQLPEVQTQDGSTPTSEAAE